MLVILSLRIYRGQYLDNGAGKFNKLTPFICLSVCPLIDDSEAPRAREARASGRSPIANKIYPS